jgi:AraC-like DNA-binding protein
MLGFSQQSAFTRAFRRWTGASPSEYRQRAFIAASAAKQ